MSLQKLSTNLLFVKEKIDQFFHPESERDVRVLQFFWLSCGGFALLLIAYALLTFLYSSNPLKPDEQKKPTPTRIESALSKVDTAGTWQFKTEGTLEKISARLDALDKLLSEGVKKGDFADPHQSEEDTLESDLQTPQNDNTTHTQDLNAKFLQLEMKLDELKAQGSDFSAPQAGGTHQEGSIIQKVTLGLSEGPKLKRVKTVDTTIPAGAFAKTMLLSGLDASASMSASSDPRPMLLRIIDPGTLPRRFQSDLKDCHCTASAYGDLSSERVYARLEKLSCIERATGEIIETQVAGYIAGSDGKAGIRGTVASKDGQFLGRSLVGGIFAGLSNVANPSNRQQQANPFIPGGAVAPPSIGSTFASGMATGATTALDRLSQYYIDRAEQLQPVIQIAAGQVVDIVFTEGTFIGSQDIKTEIENTRNESRSGNSQTSTTNTQKQGD